MHENSCSPWCGGALVLENSQTVPCVVPDHISELAQKEWQIFYLGKAHCGLKNSGTRCDNIARRHWNKNVKYCTILGLRCCLTTSIINICCFVTAECKMLASRLKENTYFEVTTGNNLWVAHTVQYWHFAYLLLHNEFLVLGLMLEKCMISPGQMMVCILLAIPTSWKKGTSCTWQKSWGWRFESCSTLFDCLKHLCWEMATLQHKMSHQSFELSCVCLCLTE